MPPRQSLDQHMNENKYQRLNKEHVSKLVELLGGNLVSQDKEQLEKYGRDETEDLLFLPEIVVKPETTEQVAAVASFCNNNRLPLTTRGAGTGLSGGALPVKG